MDLFISHSVISFEMKYAESSDTHPTTNAHAGSLFGSEIRQYQLIERRE